MQVIYGRDEVELDALDGLEVGAIQGRLKSFMGIPSDALAIVDGVEVGPAFVAQDTSLVEFRKERGHKSVGKVWTQQEYCQLFGLSEKDLEQQIERGLKIMQLADGTMRITESAADDFVRGGNGDGAFLAVIASSLKRIADHVDPPPPDVVDTTYIANKLGCTKVWVAQMALEKLIPVSCILPGTGNGKPWKFYRSRIDKWIELR